jgi:superfamily II DNA/RNA helicase
MNWTPLMTSFQTFNLPSKIMEALDKMQFKTPTPIQAQAIPLALKGKDILGSAQTGTGKTIAFGVPLINHLLENKDKTALVLSPTRELAVQIHQELKKLSATSPQIKSALLIGGEKMGKQLQQLRSIPRLIVGTPGRVLDHLQQKSVKLDQADFLVLDETDRMLDMGFEIQVEKILKYVPQKRQTLLFSATLPPYIINLSKKYLKNPERIAVGSTTTPIIKIKQEIIPVQAGKKYEALLAELQTRTSGSIIIFSRTKHGADRLAKKISQAGYKADSLHGDLSQNQRTRVIDQFRAFKFHILVATDIAARGLDIPHIEHVINYDLPQVAEDYIHRIGRTGRNGASGEAVCLIAPEDKSKWQAIQLLMNPSEKKTSNAAPQPQHNKRRQPMKSRQGHEEGRSHRGQAQGQKSRSDRPEGRKAENPNNPYAPTKKRRFQGASAGKRKPRFAGRA